MAAIQEIRRALAGPWVPPSLGKTPYLWSASLGFFLWKYLYTLPSRTELLALLVSVLLFLPVYFISFWPHQQRSVLMILLSCLFGVLWAPHNFGACAFFIFACAMCSGLQPERRAYAGVAAVLALATATAFLLDRPPLSFIVPTLITGLPVGLACIMETKVRTSRDRLMRKQEEVEHLARIAERERISRDLHDLLGHTLSLITLKAELAGKLLGRDAAACAREIGDIERCARDALAEVRSAVTGYRQTGLAHELATARASLAAANIAFAADVPALALPAPAENVMSLALREAVTNILRHAGASRCDLRLSVEGAMLVLTIEDDGVRALPGQTPRLGNGLSGMTERVQALGGELSLRMERGFALTLSLPAGEQA